MNRPSLGAMADVPHIAAVDGHSLRIMLLSQLQQPYLRRATILAFRYNDFDLVAGPRGSPTSSTGLLRLLERAVVNGVDLTLVTRDALAESDIPKDLGQWYAGLRRLHLAGARVRLHRSLHAKVYLLESEGPRTFFAVGSSNLTYQGMGFRWAECNVRGYHPSEFALVLRHATGIAGSVEAVDFATWELLARRSPKMAGYLQGK